MSNVGIVTIPISGAGLIPLSNLVDIVSSFSDKVCLVTGDVACAFFKDNHKIKLYGVGNSPKPNTFDRIAKYIPTQLRMSYRLARASATTDLWIFFIGGPVSPLPILTAKLFGKKVVLAYGGSGIESMRTQSKVLSKLAQILTRASSTLSDKIILYSQNLVQEYNFKKYRHKISMANEYFLDFNKFKIQKQLDERDNLIGYIGRLSPEKGILNFVKAVPEVLKERDEIRFLVGGDGQLRDEIEKYLDSENLTGKVKLVGWIPHDELLNYLNELKLIVLPSYTEGLPGIMLEAMACGTPVLVTPVGAIPDVIKHGETGFIMENNSPKSIARDILGAVGYPGLSRIAQNARRLAEQEYTYEVTVELYKAALGELMKGKQ